MHLPDAVEAIRSCVVQVRAEPEGQTARPLGTGFIVTALGHVLTARHVIDAGEQLIAKGGRFLVGLAMPQLVGSIRMSGSFEVVTVDVVARDDRHDLALLKMSPNPFQSGRQPGVHPTPDGGIGINALWGLAPLNADRPRDGDAIAVSGYPLSEPALVTTAGQVASAWGVDTQQVKPPGAPDWYTMPDIKDSYLLDVAVNPGNSGGPVFRPYTGDVLGVAVAFRPTNVPQTPFVYNSGLAVAVPIQYGIELIHPHLPQRPQPTKP